MRSIDSLPRAANGVVLRRLATADLGAFQAYRHDVLLGRYQGWSAMSDADAALFIAEMNTAELFQEGVWSQIGIADADDMMLIGDIGLLLTNGGRDVEIGFTLRRASQDRGLATDAVREVIAFAFEHTQAERVLGITDTRNLSSIRLLERVGMRKTAASSAVFRGEPCIELTYAIARP
jgi:[ribosomal protein S5]-alanine N-acetyltransferase